MTEKKEKKPRKPTLGEMALVVLVDTINRRRVKDGKEPMAPAEILATVPARFAQLQEGGR